ncbi:hypothetical protein [Maribellus sediminis]|uniref:hypothetical protein n=1 Tax=Maribellus sediminis TaxID=2696285 RepID=UPI0014321D1C|nr:hypothetical protein [Maribellus sediminis]
MDDLIVIILTIVVAAIGIIGQRNKKKAAQVNGTPGEAPKQQPMDFWDLIMNEENRATQFQPQAYYEEEDEIIEEQKQPPVVEKPRQYEFAADNEGRSDIEEELRKALEPRARKLKIEGEEFSLRKAVIYSEILNRKYT